MLRQLLTLRRIGLIVAASRNAEHAIHLDISVPFKENAADETLAPTEQILAGVF